MNPLESFSSRNKACNRKSRQSRHRTTLRRRRRGLFLESRLLLSDVPFNSATTFSADTDYGSDNLVFNAGVTIAGSNADQDIAISTDGDITINASATFAGNSTGVKDRLTLNAGGTVTI